jgi:hypothetical protein
MEVLSSESYSKALARVELSTEPQENRVTLRHGAGLTMFQFSTLAAVRWVVEKFTADPTHFTSLIDDCFGDDEYKEKILGDLYANQTCSSSLFKILQRHCDRLVKFARPQ